MSDLEEFTLTMSRDDGLLLLNAVSIIVLDNGEELDIEPLEKFRWKLIDEIIPEPEGTPI